MIFIIYSRSTIMNEPIILIYSRKFSIWHLVSCYSTINTLVFLVSSKKRRTQKKLFAISTTAGLTHVLFTPSSHQSPIFERLAAGSTKSGNSKCILPWFFQYNSPLHHPPFVIPVIRELAKYASLLYLVNAHAAIFATSCIWSRYRANSSADLWAVHLIRSTSIHYN